ncbi:acyl carrier protein [Streptomyces sp. YIM 98790]|uniref:acyl carrier protein n=1 Tax=Streptomyces sp. YIM 98790 TaxID=2689077 RepID=UPI001409881D|nr:acyl carrier protein [Streptomyces sp. YIM 98790]
MAGRTMTVEELTTILRECAGEDEGVDLDGDILDTEFADLGYESLALLEASGRIEREYDITLSEEALTQARTPRALLEFVNAELRSPDPA